MHVQIPTTVRGSFQQSMFVKKKNLIKLHENSNRKSSEIE